MKKLLLTVATCLSLESGLWAQTNSADYWQSVSESQIQVTGKRQIVPQKYISLNLNTQNFHSALFAAPLERNTQINQSACVISLPLPNGQYQRFRVIEAPMMAEALAAAFPNIKTFSIKGIDDETATGKLDWTEFGFHAMVISSEGDFFIDPYCLGNTTQYISYYTNDFVKPASDVMLETGVLGVPEKAEQKPAKSGNTNTGAKPAAAPCVGANLRSYRLAVACTGEYAVAATGQSAPTVAQTLAKIVTSVNRVDGVYEKEIAVRLVLVATETIVVYTSASTDPFAGNNNANTLINESQTVINNNIGSANYDIGHTFSTGGGGLANLGCVCQSGIKAKGITGSPSPVGDPYDIDYVAHEMGHQFGGNHTFNCGTGSCSGNRNPSTSMEPGSGVTIMAYAGICGSIDNLANNSIAYFHAVSYDEIINYTNFSSGNSCAVIIPSGNQAPVVTGSSNYTVPKSTPFFLTGSATDPDGDPLTYSWEEMDAGLTTSSWNTGTRPYFRSYVPTTNPTRLFPNATVVNSGNYTGTRGEYLPTTAQTLNFRLTARDNKMGGGGVCYANNQVVIDASGPFTVTYPSATGVVWYSSAIDTVKWDVNGTDQAPVACDSVRILISFNSGTSYSVLVASTPNDGYQLVTVPTVSANITTCRIKVESKGNIFYDIGNNVFTITTDAPPPPADVNVKVIGKNTINGLQVWPNPFKQSLFVSAANLDAKSTTDLLVTNVLGEVVWKSTYKNKTQLGEELDLTHLAGGVYFIRLSNGNQQAMYKVVKD
jgi:hypothetical protein